MEKVFCVIFFLLFISELSHCQNNDHLVSVVVIYRHGARTPVVMYPNDPNQEDAWPQGLGELTNDGKIQLYQLGQWLRTRYDGFISQQYKPKEIYVRSTDLNRALMSAECCLAGLYPPTDDQIWNPLIPWQPIPVHTSPESQDIILRMLVPCPKYTQLRKELYETAGFQTMNKSLRSLYNYLSESSGKPFYNLEEFLNVYDTIYVEKQYNLTAPQWASAVYPDKLKPWALFSIIALTYTKEMARLKIGPFLNEVAQHFSSCKSTSSKGCYKIRMYSSHDHNLISLLNTLELISPIEMLPYASALLFELRQNNSGYYVNILYKNSSVVYNLNLKGCESDCDFDRFVNILEPLMLTVDQWKDECASSDKSDIFVIMYPLLVVLVCLVLCAITYGLLKYCLITKKQLL